MLTIFGVQEEYDEGEIRDAEDLLANPSGEPELFEQYTAFRDRVTSKIAASAKAISLNEIKAIAIKLLECEQENNLSPQSTELSTESVVMPVENVGEVEKSEENVEVEGLIDNCTEESGVILPSKTYKTTLSSLLFHLLTEKS